MSPCGAWLKPIPIVHGRRRFVQPKIDSPFERIPTYSLFFSMPDLCRHIRQSCKAHSHIGPYLSGTAGTSRPQRFSFVSPFETENARPRARIQSEWGFEPRKYCAFFANVASGIPPAHRARHRRTLSKSAPGEDIREPFIGSVPYCARSRSQPTGHNYGDSLFWHKKRSCLIDSFFTSSALSLKFDLNSKQSAS